MENAIQDLEYYIKNSGFKIGFICNRLGISRASFDKKRKGITPFRTLEVEALCNLLNIPNEKIQAVFFMP